MRDVTTEWQSFALPIEKTLAHVVQRLRAHLVGFAGPPGAGKSTLAHLVADELDGLMISMDDFYLSRAERSERGLAWRGPPGSHDVQALLDVLDRFRSNRVPVTVPRFSAEIDDRVEPATISNVPAHVILEGWVLGHRAGGYEEILDRLDLLVFLDVPVDTARSRRFSREQLLRERGGGFSEHEMRRFWDEVLEPGIGKWVREAKETADLILELDGKEPRRVRTSSQAVRRVLENQSISGAG